MATERHLWLNLADIGRKEKAFLLDGPLSPSGLFGTSTEAVVEKQRRSPMLLETSFPAIPSLPLEPLRGLVRLDLRIIGRNRRIAWPLA